MNGPALLARLLAAGCARQRTLGAIVVVLCGNCPTMITMTDYDLPPSEVDRILRDLAPCRGDLAP